ncbi:hypothetical protein COS55_03395 [Candidatus Shapirobacteria bacterium CG03_land_8_20_14_0_80_40_19]|uniref:DUF3800 domain-containing protein n=3 Tax=Candidatus Shapironibacteriota TaxID=1752721 RepID=A0A2M7BBK8_9BACT|nr:MAG: hypothetical protein COV89_00680 [Candidatus Shapirobacteria bacterium CG11_big_fil_rev_8_21_14_0_20_40_12]PIV00495.1 MAG: hypothetical protein COS55_03395 [Candidatus Shapirobacteria bacterium CG03_land_8_20_14_0_80_40_19]PJC28894.1 MAG: hypothetical protein CO053_02195 [Candidatus Shapirobacteria bacterium CG_4_9_14_0_2_um_filter_40_11]
MIIFIDESGDPGFKITKGSSSVFVIILVIFDDELEAEETALKIKKLKRDLGKSERFEFKFNGCNKELRIKFLGEVKNCKFRIRSIILSKNVIYSKYLRNSKDSFYNFALKQVLEHNNKSILKAKIRLDGSGEKVFRKKLTLYLRKSLNSSTKKVMQNLRFRDSKNDVLIQLADMIAGSIRRYCEKNTEDWNVYREIIKKREEDAWEFK